MATVVVERTLTFDLTFLIPRDTRNWCQQLNVTLRPLPGVKALADRVFLYEFYNTDNYTLARFHNLTQAMSLKQVNYYTTQNIENDDEVNDEDDIEDRDPDAAAFTGIDTENGSASGTNGKGNAESPQNHNEQNQPNQNLNMVRLKRSHVNRKLCKVHPFVFNVHKDLGMTMVVHPNRLDIGQCRGKCNESPDLDLVTEYNTGHRVLLNIFEMTPLATCDIRQSSERVKCVPESMGAYTFMFYRGPYHYTMKTYPAVRIISCRCI